MHKQLGIVSLAILAGAVGFLFQGSRGLFEPSEGRYAESAREMLESGDYLEPTLDFRPHWTKPPMAYWATAAGLKLVGRNDWGGRFANAFAFLLTTLLVAAIGDRLWDARTGLVAGLVYLSSPFPVLGASFLTADTLLALWEVAAVCAFVLAWRSESTQKARWWSRAMWLCFGLGFLTKGPVALVPLLALVGFSLGNKKRVPLFDVLGVLVFFITGCSWYALVSLRHSGLLSYFVGDEVLARSLTDKFHRNPEWWAPFAIYIPTLIAATGPWAVAAAVQARRCKEVQASARRPWGEAGTAKRLIFLWFVLPLVIFFLSKSRLILYVLPLHAPLTLAVAALVAKRMNMKSIATVASVAILLSLGVKASIPLVNKSKNAQLLHAAALSAGGKDAHYVLLGEGGLYGLQFYFDGELERVSVRGTEPWARRSLDALISDAMDTDSNQAFVVITDIAGARQMEEAMAGSPRSISRTRAYGREILVVAPREPAR